MADLQGRKVFKVFNQDFIVDERYTVTKGAGPGRLRHRLVMRLPPPPSEKPVSPAEPD